jgi:hypothetical protein
MNLPTPVVLLIGAAAGILVGLTGTSGAFLIPLMTLLFGRHRFGLKALRYSLALCRSTSLHLFPITALGTTT